MTARLFPLRPSTSPLATPLPRVLRPKRALPNEAVRPTRAEINLAHLRHNLRVAERASQSPVWSVLKADAYGHGAKAVARTLERAGTAGICVALLEEAIELREAGIKLPIVVMGGYYGGAWGELLRHELTPIVYDAGQIEALADEVRFSGSEPLRVHLKVDTGMARLGVTPRAVMGVARALLRHPEVVMDGLMTHFACADSGETESVERQLDVFDHVTAELAKDGLTPRVRHAANSAAMFQVPRSHLDAVRPGLALFGVEPRPGMCAELRPAMRVRSEVVALRDLDAGDSAGYGATWTASRASRVATVPLGYADGLSRAVSNKGHLLVRGKRAPIVGAVSMDLTMIDVTDVPGVDLRDEVVAIGPQRGPLGADEITIAELAEQMGTIPWEVLTNVSRRVPRFYREP
ncbi:MAG TPA: alanine racemase [Polyangiaceae bacterium]|jgi:alanine racemase|nr:alanine racemase [Polyangiaceae bacterium]